MNIQCLLTSWKIKSWSSDLRGLELVFPLHSVIELGNSHFYYAKIQKTNGQPLFDNLSDSDSLSVLLRKKKINIPAAQYKE